MCRNILLYCISDVILEPNSKIYITWMSCTAMAVLYNLWVIPLRSTFPYQTKSNRAIWMTFDYIADIIYLIDMIFVQPRVKYLCDGFWVIDIKLLRKNYIKSKRFKVSIQLVIQFLTEVLMVISSILSNVFMLLNVYWNFISFSKLSLCSYACSVLAVLLCVGISFSYSFHVLSCNRNGSYLTSIFCQVFDMLEWNFKNQIFGIKEVRCIIFFIELCYHFCLTVLSHSFELFATKIFNFMYKKFSKNINS